MVLSGPDRAAATVADHHGFWGFSPEINVPVGARFTLIGAETCDTSGRYCLDFPLVAFGFDVTRPSSPGSKSVNLAFVQAPITGAAAMAAVIGTRSPTLRAAALALAWLSGGMFRVQPGGDGNLDQDKRSVSLSLVMKNEVALHPFVSPNYLRVSPGAGLALTWGGRGQAGIPWELTCGAGGFASLAAEHGGREAWQPGVWLTCFSAVD